MRVIDLEIERRYRAKIVERELPISPKLGTTPCQKFEDLNSRALLNYNLFAFNTFGSRKTTTLPSWNFTKRKS